VIRKVKVDLADIFDEHSMPGQWKSTVLRKKGLVGNMDRSFDRISRGEQV
jgi:hypothetical protein